MFLGNSNKYKTTNNVIIQIKIAINHRDENKNNDKDEKDMLDITKREGNVLFKHGEDYKLISIPIVNEFKFDKNAKLEVTLSLIR